MTRKWYFISIVRSYNHAKKTSIINLKPFGIMESIDILVSLMKQWCQSMVRCQTAWALDVYQEMASLMLIYNIWHFSSKTLPRTKSDRETLLAMKLLDTSRSRFLDKSSPKTSLALRQVFPLDKSSPKTSPALRQVWPKNAWTSQSWDSNSGQ